MNEVKVGKVYRHFKGNYYFIEGIGIDSETLNRLVIYKPLYDNKDLVWVRTEEDFLKEVESNRPGNITGQTHRFEFCKELSNNYINR